MAGSSLLALIDDIATLLDDVSAMTKVAAKNTAGVLGDDLALNAQQVTGVSADRELPVVWAVAKGSLLNKLILVPAALLISALLPAAIGPLLMLGGAFLCFEGCEKLAHALRRHKAEQGAAIVPAGDPLAYERDKIKGAIRTDFVLSAEIIAITLGAVAGAPFLQQVVVLAAIAVLITFGVYGIVAAIVKLDDLGLYLCGRRSPPAQRLGGAILRAAPWLMKALSVLGTVAMFMVGGGILVHGIAPLHHLLAQLAALPAGGALQGLFGPLLHAACGVVFGAVLLAAAMLFGKLRGRAA